MTHFRSPVIWLCLLLQTAGRAEAEEPLRFGTFTNINSPGLVTCERVLREAYGKLGRSIVVEHMPAKRSLYWAESGRLDGDLCRAKSSDNLIKVPTPIFQWKLSAFSTRQLEIKSWSDLKSLKVGYERGMTIVAQHNELTLLPANNIESAILQASKDRVDVLLDDQNTVIYNARRMNIHNLIANEPPLVSGPTFHLLNSTHQQLAEQLNAVLQQMDAAGRMKQIEHEVMQEFMRKAEQESLLAKPVITGPTLQ